MIVKEDFICYRHRFLFQPRKFIFGAFGQAPTIFHLRPKVSANKARNRPCSISRAEKFTIGQNSLQLSGSTPAHAFSKMRRFQQRPLTCTWFPCAVCNPRAIFSNSAWLRVVMIRSKSGAINCAKSSPMPLEAPVINAVLRFACHRGRQHMREEPLFPPKEPIIRQR